MASNIPTIIRSRNPGKIDFNAKSGGTISLIYQSPGDTNGLFYYLGTKGRTQAFSNPGSDGTVNYSESSRLNNQSSVSAGVTLNDRGASDTPFHTNSGSNQYVEVNLKRSFNLTGYSIQGRTDFTGNHPRAWNMLGSNDGINWTIVDSVTGANINQSTWFFRNINSSDYFSYYRLQATGPDSSGAYYLVFAEWEFYGTLINNTQPQDNTVLLIHFDGVEGSQQFTDVKGHPITRNGNVAISTAQSKFGGSSVYFPGTLGNYLQLNPSVDWELSGTTFTIEAWVYLTGNGVCAIVGTGQDTAGAGWLLYISPTDLTFESPGGYQNWNLQKTIPINSWCFVSVSKAADNTAMYMSIDGLVTTVARTTQHAGIWINNNAPLRIGQTQHPNYPFPFAGYIDYIRIAKG